MAHVGSMEVGGLLWYNEHDNDVHEKYIVEGSEKEKW